MDNRRIVQVLIDVRDNILTNERVFAREGHFFDKYGNKLKVCPHSAKVAVRRCIEGAILTSLWKFGFLGEDENHQSPACRNVMRSLGTTLGYKGEWFKKIDEMQRYSNRYGFAATMKVVQDTIDRLSPA